MQIEPGKFQVFESELRQAMMDAAIRMIEASWIWQKLRQGPYSAEHLADQRTLNKELAEHLKAELAEMKAYKNGDLAGGPGWLAAIVDNRVEEHEILIEALRRHKRELDLMAGEKIEPEVHFAQATLVGRMGGGM